MDFFLFRSAGNIYAKRMASISTSYDVALAVQWIFTYCNVNGNVGGSCAANGNGNLIVGVENINW